MILTIEFFSSGSLCVHRCVFTFVVMPNTYFPDIPQAGVRGNVKDVQCIAHKGSPAVEMAMPTAAFTPIQTDSHMSRGAWTDRERLLAQILLTSSTESFIYF